jgi:hypothetical protein
MKGTVRGKQSTLLSVPMFLLEEIPWIIILTNFCPCVINAVRVNLVAIGQ